MTTTATRLDALRKTCPRIAIPPPVVFIADTHVCDGSKADNLWPHRFRFEKATERYGKPWKVVTLGDMFDFHQATWEAIWKAGYSKDLLNWLLNAVIRIPGNHDLEMGGPEAVILEVGGQEIFCAHGHQGDRWSDQWAGIGRFFVRYFWTPIERLGIKQPDLPGNRHAAQRVNLVDWSNERKIPSVYGHIHTYESTGFCHVCESPTTGNMRFLEFTSHGWNVWDG